MNFAGLLQLAIRSIRNRGLTTGLTVLSIALSVALLIGVEHIRTSARASFQGTISQTDLIVGARSGPIQLLLYSVFHMGSATSNIDFESYKHFRDHPAVEWTIPISLGDSHRGHRVVATDQNFYEHYRFRGDRRIKLAAGETADGVFDVVLGSEVAAKLGYEVGKKIVLSHGMSSIGLLNHDDKPFTVVGVLERTSTPVDRSLYITLEGMEAIHIDWQSGAPPMFGEEIPAEKIDAAALKVEQLTAFLLRNKSRVLTLRLQREVNTFEGEALLGIIPGVTLSELWQSIGYAEAALLIVTIIVVLVGLVGMLMSIYTTLNERRREMAILRSLGAGPRKILMLFVLESGLLSVAGCVLGVVLVYVALFFAQPIVENQMGLYLAIDVLSPVEFAYLGGVIVAGFLIGLVPALRAYRNALADGLTIRV
ncbi:MAG: FtsX-like permease family protein [Leptospirales bacterium]|jgi:putative ABC transport system permease protein